MAPGSSSRAKSRKNRTEGSAPYNAGANRKRLSRHRREGPAEPWANAAGVSARAAPFWGRYRVADFPRGAVHRKSSGRRRRRALLWRTMHVGGEGPKLVLMPAPVSVRAPDRQTPSPGSMLQPGLAPKPHSPLRMSLPVVVIGPGGPLKTRFRRWPVATKCGLAPPKLLTVRKAEPRPSALERPDAGVTQPHEARMPVRSSAPVAGAWTVR